jgi:hypothetical protein
MIAYQNPEHASYHGPKVVKCYGCGSKCAKSAWGNWCHPCNVKRLDQIGSTLESMVEKAKFDAAVREAVSLNDRVYEKLHRENIALIRAAGGTVTVTKEQLEAPCTYQSCSYDKDGSQTFRAS